MERKKHFRKIDQSMVMMWMMKFQCEVINYLWVTSVQNSTELGCVHVFIVCFFFVTSFKTSHVLFQIA